MINWRENPAEIDAAWDALIKCRIEEIELGKVKLIPLDEVEAEIDAFVSSLDKA